MAKGDQGISSRHHVQTPVRTGTGSKGTRPAGTAQVGIMYGDKATHGNPKGTGYTGERLHNDRNFQPVKFGNEVALNVGRGGPGTGRTLHGSSGSQGTHGPVAGTRRPASRGILTNE
jgi:hypothetical protein